MEITTRLAAVLFAAFTLTIQPAAQADTFGTSGNEFTIDFVNIGNTGNAADTTGYGAVPYEYRVGTYEITQDAITKATASGMANVTAGAWTGSQPAANISWYEAAAFVNWLNTSTGKTAAYDLAWDGSAWSMNLWSSGQAWTAGGENLYRNKDAFYFLPSENEWYKAAYYNAAGTNYFLYPTASSSLPTAVASGTDAGSAVYGGVVAGAFAPAIVDSAGGLSPYGTMGQGGNVSEWTESAFAGTNSSPSEVRAVLGGDWLAVDLLLRSGFRSSLDPSVERRDAGFRVAQTVPELGDEFDWSGGSGTWSTAANWTNNATPPATGAKIYYSGAGGGLSTNNSVATAIEA
jgi:formylglycine-generating enzyme